MLLKRTLVGWKLTHLHNWAKVVSWNTTKETDVRQHTETHIVAVNDRDKLVNKRRTRQHQTSDKSNRQIKMFRLQAGYTRRQ